MDKNQHNFVHTMLNVVTWISRSAAWLLIPILLLVLIGVILSSAKVGIITRWESDIFLFGSKLTLASIGDLQWHLFGIMLMLTLAGALVEDAHVRVDFLRQHMSERKKTIIDILGHIFFLVPFCALIVYNGIDFTMRSFSMGEGSNYDGLYDRFFLKSFIPIGFVLILFAGVGLIAVKFKYLMSMKEENQHD